LLKRYMGVDTPIIALSQFSDLHDRVETLRHGADVTLCDPFDIDELSATIEALIRRRVRHPPHDSSLQAPDIELHLANRLVTHGGRVVQFTHTQFRLLEYMMRNQRRILTRIEILEAI
jgi:two-component system OmpR family response regulator